MEKKFHGNEYEGKTIQNTEGDYDWDTDDETRSRVRDTDPSLHGTYSAGTGDTKKTKPASGKRRRDKK